MAKQATSRTDQLLAENERLRAHIERLKPKGEVVSLRKTRENDAITHKLISRKNGATVAEIRAATGWKGVIQKGPERVARNAGRKLKWEGNGENRRFWYAD